MQACACIVYGTVHNAGMVAQMHMHERPAGLSAGEAFLCAEAWRSGLTHRAYPSADLWASKPLAGSRQFESDRFHHLTSGAAVVAAAAAPDHQPRDLAPKRTTVLDSIRLAGLIFQNCDGPHPQMTDLARHEQPLPRQAN